MASTPRVLHLIPILVVVLSFHLIVCVSFCGVAAAFCPRPVASMHATPWHHGAAAFCINACHATDDAPRLVIRSTDGAAHCALAPGSPPHTSVASAYAYLICSARKLCSLLGRWSSKKQSKHTPNDPSTFARANILPLASRRARPVPSASFLTCHSRSASILRPSIRGISTCWWRTGGERPRRS